MNRTPLRHLDPVMLDALAEAGVVPLSEYMSLSGGGVEGNAECAPYRLASVSDGNGFRTKGNADHIAQRRHRLRLYYRFRDLTMRRWRSARSAEMPSRYQARPARPNNIIALRTPSRSAGAKLAAWLEMARSLFFWRSR